VLTTDLAIIGAGPGGYVAALRAAQLGMKVTVIENSHLGGICLNRGCIPTKAMLQAAAVAHQVRNAAAYGVIVAEPQIDYTTALARRDEVIAALRDGVRGLLRRAKAQTVAGNASFTGPRTLVVEPVQTDIGAGKGVQLEGQETVEAAHIIVATGSRPAPLPVPGVDLPRVIDSDGALGLTEIPASLLVVGAGAVGCEWSLIFARLGTKVTLVEMLPTVLPREDADVSSALQGALESEGVTVQPNTSLVAIKKRGDKLEAELSGESASFVKQDYVLVAGGRLPLTEGLNLEAAGVATDSKGWILTDPYQKTNVPSVLAIGDVTGRALLAHVASRQGIVAVEKLGGLSPQPIADERIPSVTYTDPEVASVGLTEAQAREKGMSVLIGRFPFSASGRAKAQGTTTGLVKIVAESGYGRVLGVHMVGPHVGELLAEAVLALELEATIDELASVVRAHPTLSEALGEAALDAAGRRLH
jgi:dihydrolipoamide dehydrogenase